MELGLREIMEAGILLVTVCGAYFLLRAKQMVLEVKLDSHIKHADDTSSKIERALQRIEEKLDNKADR